MRLYMGGKTRLYLQSASIVSIGESQFLVCLLAMSDTRRPDQVFTNPVDDERRVLQKLEGEGLDCSCHVVISCNPTQPGSSSYKLAVENVPTFSVSFVARYIRFVFRKLSILRDISVASPTGEMVNGVPEMVSLIVQSELRGVPSGELLNDLENGVLSEIELVREISAGGGWDEGNYVVEKTNKIIVKPRVATSGAFVMQTLRSACAKGVAQQYSTATIRWKSSGNQKSAKFSCDDVGLLSDRYIKRESFVLADRLPASCEEINPGFARQLSGWLL